MNRIPILGKLTPGKTQRHLIKLPGAALAKDEPRPVISITGAKPGPVLFVNAGVHGGEYPAVEAVIRLSNTLDPKKIAGTVILMPVPAGTHPSLNSASSPALAAKPERWA